MTKIVSFPRRDPPYVPPPERLPLLSGAEVAIMAMQVAAGAFVVYAMLVFALAQ